VNTQFDPLLDCNLPDGLAGFFADPNGLNPSQLQRTQAKLGGA
jgi:hypothetical protein